VQSVGPAGFFASRNRPARSVFQNLGEDCMEVIELLAKLQANKKELSEMEEKITTIEKEIAMTRKEIVDFCKTTEDYELVFGSSFRNGIAQSVKNAKYVSIFSSNLFANPDFAEIVRGKRYGLFRSDSDFAPVVKFVGFDLLDHPDEYKKGRKAAEELARQRKIIVMFDKEMFFENGLVQ
jgi:hypothetical protein